MPAVMVIDVTVDDDDGVHYYHCSIHRDCCYEYSDSSPYWYSSSYCVVSTIDDCVVRMSWTDGVVVDVVS